MLIKMAKSKQNVWRGYMQFNHGMERKLNSRWLKKLDEIYETDR